MRCKIVSSFFVAVVIGLLWCSLGNSAEQADKDAVVYSLKPGLNYRYGVELTSGEDGKGPLHRTGSMIYSVTSQDNGQLSVMEQAKRELRGGGDPKSIKVHYSGSINMKDRGNDGAHGTITIAPDGQVESTDAQSDISLVTSPVSCLVFPQLPPAGKKTWSANRHRTISFSDDPSSSGPSDPFRRFNSMMPTFPHGPNPGFQRGNSTEANVDEKFDYELAELNANTAKIKYKVKGDWTVGDKPFATVDGEGQYSFDRAQGVMTTGYSECKLHVKANGIETSVPFQLAFKLNDALTAEQTKERDEKNQKEAEAHAEKIQNDIAAAQAKRLDDSNARFTKSMAALKNPSARPEAITMALSELAMLGHDDRFMDQINQQQREDIGRHLIPLIKRNEEMVRSQALQAATSWATSADIPILLQALGAGDDFHRSQIIEALGTSGGNEKAAAALAKLLDTTSSFEVSRALCKMKPQFVEPVVLPVLQTVDSSNRHFVYDVLAATGGKKSQEAIEARIANMKDEGEKMEAKRALDKIKEHVAFQTE